MISIRMQSAKAPLQEPEPARLASVSARSGFEVAIEEGRVHAFKSGPVAEDVEPARIRRLLDEIARVLDGVSGTS